ncbi:MAG: hypothetical protein DHS20C15_28330 [Planctomycetota bacterium]|nr:MAG: hypothetical protein DHS20C15_28330 [Planctomycetota bacterium]
MITIPSTLRMVAGAFAAAVLAVGCSSAPASSEPESPNSPIWIDQPQSLVDEGNNVVIYAVGSAADNPNRSARRSMAMARARQELAATMGVLVQSMVVSYMDTNRDFYDMDSASSTEYYQDISRQVTQEMLVGSRQEQAYRDPISNEYYVLMRVDLDDVINSYKAKMSGTFDREATRRRIKANMEEFQGEMDAQLDKLRNMDAADLEAALLNGEG